MKIGNTLYLDHQATTPVDPGVLAAMTPFFNKDFGNPHSEDHILGWSSAQAVELASERVAALIGADPDEIIFTSGATEANNLALLGLARRATDSKRHRILMSAVEHKSVLEIGRVLGQHLEYKVDILGVDNNGQVLIPELEQALDHDVLAISVMAVNNEIGTIQNINKISELAHDYGAYFHTDAAQAPCAINMGLFAQKVDLLSLSSHKMYGPKGIGVLFVRREIQSKIEPLIYGGGQQCNLRSGTIPTALCVGIGAAAELITASDSEKMRREIQKLGNLFLEQLQLMSWPIFINSPNDSFRHPGNVNIRIEGFSARDILSSCQPLIAASTGSACTTGLFSPSHVLTAIGLTESEANSSIRFSLGANTTEDHILEASKILNQTLSQLKDSNLTITE
jgi:cysteine desulfurase